MKNVKYIIGLISIFALGFTNLMAQDLISAKDFIAELKNSKELVIIDAGTADDYTKRHVRGAISVPHKELYKEGAIEGLIKSPDGLAKYFGDKGVSNTSAIVVYDDGSNKYSSRVYWILKYLGAENVKVLHKDMEKEWRAARVPLTAAVSTGKPVTFTPKPNATIIATIDEVKAGMNNPNVIIIDSRAANEFDGTSEKPVSKGHIKGAINIEYKEFLEENGNFKSKEGIEAVAKKHGLDPSKEIIAYCVTSVRACPIYIALNGAGYTNVKVYDGAYNEWIADPKNPIEK
nr:sulfurtransferase [Bacteroidota bacterium]